MEDRANKVSHLPPPPPQRLKADTSLSSSTSLSKMGSSRSFKYPSSNKAEPKLDESESSGRQLSKINSTLHEIMKKQIDELRQQLFDYSVVKTRLHPKLNYDALPNHCEIICFGPSGSGKSSLIRTLYRALHQVKKLPEQYEKILTVKGKSQNQGTVYFTRVTLKGEMSKMGDGMIGDTSSSIRISDTRGQIWMDQKESKQIDLIIQGRVKNLTKVEQRTYRYAHLLWEFWKKDTDLFPKDIYTRGPSLKTRPHCIFFVFDGSMDQIPNGAEETAFYREVLDLCKLRKYFYPQIVLTCIDKVEKKFLAEWDYLNLDDYEREQKMREVIDMKIESVVLKLGVPRSSVHFIENYHDDGAQLHQSNITIDHRVLRLLHEATQQADSYLMQNLREKTTCNIF